MAFTRNDDENPFDQNGILKDRRSVRVKMTARDGLTQQNAIARDGLQLHDGRGSRAFNKPGLGLKTTLLATLPNNLCNEYRDDLENAWRHQPTGAGSRGVLGAQEGDVCTVRGPEFPLDFGSPGHYRTQNGSLVCTPDQPRSRSSPRRTDALQQNMASIYAQADEELCNAWRGR